MAHSDFTAALVGRLQEIDELLKPWNKLIEERTYISRLLRLHTDEEAPAMERQRPERAQRGLPGLLGPPFAANPDSKASKILATAREFLEREPKHTAGFLAIYRAMPKDVLGPGRHAREHVRNTLQRAGARAGIEYVDSENVRLVGAA